MNSVLARARLSGCYVAVPGGLQTGNAVLLACGAAGGFRTMSLDERVQVTAAVIEEADGRIPVVMGAQTTSTRELATLARTAERLGAEYIQVSPPFYFPATEDDFYEFVAAAAGAADIGIIVYNTYTSSSAVDRGLVERLVEMPNVIGLKWATPTSDFMEFEQVIVQFAHRLSIIDNQVRFAQPHPGRTKHRSSRLQLLAAMGRGTVESSRRWPLSRGATRTGPRCASLLHSMERDGEPHQRRRILG